MLSYIRINSTIDYVHIQSCTIDYHFVIVFDNIRLDASYDTVPFQK